MYSISVKKKDYGWITVKYGSLLIVGVLLSFYGFSEILLQIADKQANLLPGNIERYLYENLPFPLILKVYIFHVLNKEEVHNGGKPKFKEMGPYVFHEYIKKVNTTDNENDDTLEFTLWKKYVFRPELSKGLTGEEIVTTLHPVIVGLGLVVHLEHQSFMHVAIAAIKELFHDPSDAFWTGRAMDLIFDGLLIDCSTKNPLGKLACGEIRNGGHQSIQPVNATTFKFSLLGGYNYTSNGVFKVIRGSKNYRDLGRVVEVDGQTELKVWNGEKCNKLMGTDGLIFAPFQPVNESIYIFVRQLCHSIDLGFVRKGYFRGIKTHAFVDDFTYTNMEHEENRCFCRKPDVCPLKGTIDLMPCLKVPITGSLPHFYLADESLLKNIAGGIEPDPKKHEFFLNIELRSALPLTGAGRFQLNFELMPVERIKVMANLPRMLFPFIWIDEGADVPESLVNVLKYGMIFTHRLVFLIKYGCLIIGFLGTMYHLVIFTCIKFGEVSVLDQFSKMPPSTTGSLTKLPIETKITEVKSARIIIPSIDDPNGIPEVSKEPI